jgi:DNA helicase-2/ATP-dependent DNA helicase PcrA
MWQAEKSPDAAGRLENLKELVRALGEFENLQCFLEHVALVMETSNPAEGLIMTLHAAGAGVPGVFLRLGEGLLSPARLLESGAAAWEERRLAYVGLTRARRRAVVSYVANRRIHNMWQSALPSRFVGELPRQHCEKASDMGDFGTEIRGGLTRLGETESAGCTAPRSGWTRRLAPVIDAEVRPVPRARAPITPMAPASSTRSSATAWPITADGDKLDIEFDKAGARRSSPACRARRPAR